MKSIFTSEQEKLADIILENNHISPLNELYSKEIKELALIWSYYSGRIEGNTYSFVETETLLKDNITSAKRYEEAKMLKNLYNTFIAEVQYIKNGNKEVIDKEFLLKIYSTLISDLIDNKEKGIIRRRFFLIMETDYTSSQSEFEIEDKLNEIIDTQKDISNPLEKAIYLHCNLAKLQPFIEGNKRMARLVESVALMNEDIIPIFSTNNEDINDYYTGMLHFCDTGDYTVYTDYFLRNKINYLQKLSEKNLL
ncbi:Fic family protein [Capnocytophaga gingivalis]|jgi:filamentation induced by cAMP protein fic